jgi:hypothetical protein
MSQLHRAAARSSGGGLLPSLLVGPRLYPILTFAVRVSIFMPLVPVVLVFTGVGGVPSWGWWWVPGKAGQSVEVVVGSYLVSAMLGSPCVATVILVFAIITSLPHPWLVPLRRFSGCRRRMWVVSSSPRRGKIVKT